MQHWEAGISFFQRFFKSSLEVFRFFLEVFFTQWNIWESDTVCYYSIIRFGQEVRKVFNSYL